MSKKDKEQDKAAYRRMGAAYQQSREGRPEDLYINRKEGGAASQQLDFNQNPMAQFQTPNDYAAVNSEHAQQTSYDLRDLKLNPHLGQTATTGRRLHEKQLTSHHRRGGIMGRGRSK